MAPGPGDSPFLVKGLVYLGARDFYAERLRGGPDAVGAALPAPLQSFWTQLFLASSSYDVLPLVAWMMWVVEGFTSVALETAGAPASTVRLIDEVVDGERAGIETRTLRWQLKW